MTLAIVRTNRFQMQRNPDSFPATAGGTSICFPLEGLRKIALFACVCILGLILCSCTVLSAQEPEGGHHKFTWDGSGRTMKQGAVYVSFTRYKSEDGVRVEKLVEKYASEEDAATALAKLVRSASRVLAKESVNKVEHVELAFDRAGKEEKTVMAWTDDARVFLIRSASRSHVEDFDKQDRLSH